MIANILSIAGSDPSGGAGIQADLKTFSAWGCYGMAAITALTAQNTQGVRAVHIPSPDFLAQQIDAIFEDIRVDAVKIGMLASGEIVALVADRLRAHGAKNIVVDPVLVATSGDSLGSDDVVDAIRSYLFPIATVITPNVPEAARLSGLADAADVAALEATGLALCKAGAVAALVKGGHFSGGQSEDVLVEGERISHFNAPRVDTQNTHGTGCTLSSAIAACLGNGQDLTTAVGMAKAYITEALRHSSELDAGKGHGPVHHFHALW